MKLDGALVAAAIFVLTFQNFGTTHAFFTFPKFISLSLFVLVFGFNFLFSGLKIDSHIMSFGLSHSHRRHFESKFEQFKKTIILCLIL